MSILIKGMDMPESGTYELSIDNTNGKDKTVMSLFVRGEGGLICCGTYELVPVPPHGDLIERQAVLETFSIHMNRGLHFVTIRDTIPTVIPEEPKEDTV